MQPLDGILVLDFSTLLPGPMASLLLAEAGARVIKIERPGRGDEMRSYEPKVGEDSINYHLLNRGKQSVAIDLKDKGALEKLGPLIEQADVVIEQFRPGVMDRLGLGYEAMRAINPDVIYCSITGWGQHGPKSQIAAHDLNYMAETGILGLSAGSDVNRRANGTPYRRAKGTPFHDGARLIGHAPLRCARRREGGARPEARAAQSIF